MRLFTFTFCFLFSLGCVGYEEVDSQIWLVESSGIWKDNNNYGYYRAVVTRQIGEHGSDFVSVEILVAGKSKELKKMSVITLNSPGYKGRVVDVSFNMVDDDSVILSIDIEMKAMHGVRMRDLFLIHASGEYEKVVDAKFIDIN